MTLLGETTATAHDAARQSAAPPRPRLGFLGVGWIGRHRMQSVVDGNVADIVAIADTVPAALSETRPLVPAAAVCDSLESLLEQDVDGVVIATPSALHAEQAMAALRHGTAVFCQKPLACSAAETRRVVEAAAKADRLLGVDLSYRFVNGVSQMRDLIRRGELGDIFAVDLVFHNAYGPDKAWFYESRLSGGGCLIDLGTHLADLALWVLGPVRSSSVTSRLARKGRAVVDPSREVEDYAIAQWEFESGAAARLACSWRLSAGCDCVIEASFYGTKGAVSLRNQNGSFDDLVVERFAGTQRERLAETDCEWGGRAIRNWTAKLAENRSYRADAEPLTELATLIDAMYHR